MFFDIIDLVYKHNFMWIKEITEMLGSINSFFSSIVTIILDNSKTIHYTITFYFILICVFKLMVDIFILKFTKKNNNSDKRFYNVLIDRFIKPSTDEKCNLKKKEKEKEEEEEEETLETLILKTLSILFYFIEFFVLILLKVYKIIFFIPIYLLKTLYSFICKLLRRFINFVFKGKTVRETYHYIFMDCSLKWRDRNYFIWVFIIRVYMIIMIFVTIVCFLYFYFILISDKQTILFIKEIHEFLYLFFYNILPSPSENTNYEDLCVFLGMLFILNLIVILSIIAIDIGRFLKL